MELLACHVGVLKLSLPLKQYWLPHVAKTIRILPCGCQILSTKRSALGLAMITLRKRAQCE